MSSDSCNSPMYCIVPQIVNALSPRSRRRDSPKSVKRTWPKRDTVNISIPEFPSPKDKHLWHWHLNTIQRHKIHILYYILLYEKNLSIYLSICRQKMFNNNQWHCTNVQILYGGAWLSLLFPTMLQSGSALPLSVRRMFSICLRKKHFS